MAKAPKGSSPANKGRRAEPPAGKSRRGAEPSEDMSIARKIAWWSLLALVFAVPIAMGNFTWLAKIGIPSDLPLTYDQFDIMKVFLQRVLALIALGAWSWDILTKGGKVRRTPVDWLILAFLVWVAITSMTSISPPTAIFGKYRRFEGLLSFVNYAVIYFLVLQFADRASRVRSLANSLFASSVVVAGYGVLQSVGLDPITWGALPFEQLRPFSTYGNPDLLGGFLMFSLPVALGLALSEERLWVRLGYWVGFGLNFYVWIVAFTRGAWIGGAVGLAILGVIAWRHSAKMRTVDWIPAGITALLGGGAIVRSLSNANEVMNFAKRFASILQFDVGSGRTRTEIWQAALAAIKARPITGFGADTFRLVFPKYKPVEYVKDAGYLSVADNVHDYPLQLAAGIGIPGMLMMYGIFAWAAVRSFATVFRKSSDPRRIVLGAFWAAAAGYLVQLMFGLSVTGNTFLLWTAMAVVLAPTASVLEFRPPDWGVFVAAAIIVLAGFGIGYQFVLIAADHQYLLARIAYQGDQRTQAAIRATQLNPFNDMYRAEVGLAYTDQLLGTLNAAAQAQQSGQTAQQYAGVLRDQFTKAEAANQAAIAFVPWEYDNYVFLTNLYNIGGQAVDSSFYQKAIETGRAGIQVERSGPAIRVQLARALLSTGQTDEAIKELRYAVQMDPAYTEAALMLAQALENQGKVSEAIDLLKGGGAFKNTGAPGVPEEIARLQSLISSGATPAAPTTAP